jgi:hypothetical protein
MRYIIKRLCEMGMANVEVLVLVICIFAALFGGIGYWSQRDRRLRADAEKLIREAGAKAAGSVLTGNVVFRKSRVSGILLALLFLGLLFWAIYGLRFNLGTLNKAGVPLTSFVAWIEILLCTVPLAFAVRQWFYKAVISDEGLSISSFTTRTVRFDEISDLTIAVSRGGSFCAIQLNTGEDDLSVGTDLRGFLDFVRLLSQRLSKAKAG